MASGAGNGQSFGVTTTLAERLRGIRARLGLGTNDFGRAIGSNGAQVSRLESGQRGQRISADLAVAVARAANVRVEWLITGQGPMVNDPGESQRWRDVPRWAESAELVKQANPGMAEAVDEAGAMTAPPNVVASERIVEDLALCIRRGRIEHGRRLAPPPGHVPGKSKLVKRPDAPPPEPERPVSPPETASRRPG